MLWVLQRYMTSRSRTPYYIIPYFFFCSRIPACIGYPLANRSCERYWQDRGEKEGLDILKAKWQNVKRDMEAHYQEKDG